MLGPGIQNNANLSNNGMPGNMQAGNNMNVPTNNNGGASGGGLGGGPNVMPGTMPGAMPGMQQHPSMQHVGGMADSYSMSQSQTINFTHQSLRRAGGTGKYFCSILFTVCWMVL